MRPAKGNVGNSAPAAANLLNESKARPAPEQADNAGPVAAPGLVYQPQLARPGRRLLCPPLVGRDVLLHASIQRRR